MEDAARVVACHQRSGRAERAWPLLRLLEPLVPKLADRAPRDAGLAARALATQAVCEGAVEVFLALGAVAAAAFDRAPDPEQAAFDRAALGHAHRLLGEAEEAAREIDTALAVLAVQAAPAPVHALAKRDLAAIRAAQGRLDEARALAAEAAALVAGHEDTRLPGVARIELSAVLAQAGAGGEAEEEARRALADLAAYAPGRAWAAAALSRALCAKGDPVGARDAAGSAIAIVDALGGIDEGEAFVRLAVVEARRAAGDAAGADAALAEARRRVLGAASLLGDPARRRAFLSGVPENRRILALAAPASLR